MQDYLNLDQAPRELCDLYGERDYYWYLRSPQFQEAFTKVVARLVDGVGEPVVDVGCGEAVLADHVGLPYFGFDGSDTALARAVARLLEGPPRGLVSLVKGRLESPPPLPDLREWRGAQPTLVMSGVLEVLIKADRRVDFIRSYQHFYGAAHLIVCDLERLDTRSLEIAFGPPLEELHREALGISVDHDTKRFRKILLYQIGER